MHAWFKREGIDYRHNELKTKSGEQKYWDLTYCIKHSKCPLEKGAINNLDFLIGLRNKIAHRATQRIDNAVSGEMQSCCINFNKSIKSLFGLQYGLEKRLPIALQFITFGKDQRNRLKKAQDLPSDISTFVDAFDHGLTDEELSDPAFRMRMSFFPVSNNRSSSADQVIEFIKPGSEKAEAMNQVLFKEVNKTRYTPKAIVKMMQEEGYEKFRVHDHTKLWQKLRAKDLNKGYGCQGDYKGTWVWFDRWVDRVREHCAENGNKYRADP